MMTRKALFLAAAFFAAAVVKGGEVQKTAVCASFDAATIASNGVKVADWMLAHPKRANHRDWSYGAFYAGLAEFARATGERRYIDAIREEGRTYGWKFEKRDADVGNTHCIGQAWLDIARAERDDAVVASVRAELDAFMAAHVDAPLAHREGERVVLNRRRWYWCDALFMSPPVWAKLAAITGERKYLDFMMGEYRATYDHLYDREDHLFWRDARYVGRTTPNGKKLFWGRGNGWVLAGLPFVIRELPTDSAERRWFTALFKEMCAKVRTIQRADGAWSASLLDGKNPDAPEMSATAFFCYALAWGVNNGVLDEATYLPCVERAWAAMCRCVGDDGKFGWVQPIGESPVKNFGPDSTETYGAGGYLLAAAELRRYALAHVSRVDQIAARLPERPCTPAPRPCDRAAWAPLAKDPAAAAIIASAEKLVGAKIDELSDDLYRDFSRTGNRVRYETPYFRKAYRLNLFMVAEALEWKGRLVPEIRRYLESVLDEKVWTIPATDTKDLAFVKGKPVICLFSANRAWIVAYAANWFADVLPPELVARAKSECRRRVLDLYLAACRNPSLAKGGGGDPLWWFFVRTNWSPVCHAGCVGAALAILDSRRERAECLEAVERAMPHYFRGFGRDGYCSEGMGYWNYGFGHYVALRAMAEQATGGFVTLDSPMAATAAAYAVNFQLENGLSPHFADGGGAPDLSLLDLCHRFWPKVVPSSGVGPLSLNKGDSASFSPCPACAFIALRAFGTTSIQQQGGTTSVQQQGGTSSVQQQGGTASVQQQGRTASVQQQGGRAKSCCSTLAVSPAPLPMRSVFPHSQVYLIRPGGGKDGIALGVKGGHNAELHNHNDVGSYAISLGGEVLCGDVGGELYSRRTFSSRRYDSEVLNSFGHPVPRPGVLQGLGRRYAARIIRTEFRPNRDTVVFDLTGAYPSKTLKRLHRKFIYDRAAQTVTIRDEVDFKEPTAFDDPLTTLVGVDGRAATAGVTTSVRQQGTGLVFVGKKGRLAVDVETSGGEWEWDVRTMDNGRGELPVAKDAPEGKWAVWVAGKTQNTPPDGRPRRIAVKFKKPVTSAMVEFHFRAVDANIPEPENVPELMRTFAGEEVKTKEAWENVRAPELLERFQKDVYGRRPAVLDERKRVSFKVYDERPVMDGKTVRKLVRAEFDGPLGKFSFPFTVYIPKAQKPVPAFVSICLKSRSKVGADHVITSVCWPVEQIVGRGYATIGFLTEDIATEKNTGFAQGVFTCVEKPEARTDESWGTISAWAWAASRVMDWIETEPAIDATRVGIVGHSRGGKTAIWTGVTDRRFALVCSNNSGAHGAKLNHIRLPKSEDIASIPKYFPNWYCGNYPKKYGGKEMTMDFDQHELLALIAPRLLCVASASEDYWCGQPGEWWSAKLASPAWELYGRRGLVAERYPAPGEKQQEGSVSYHLRPGKHSLDPYDWDRYMDFADKNL